LRERSATQTRNSGHCSICFWLAASRARVAFLSVSVTAITDQVWRLELVAADCAAATRVSSVPDGNGSGR